MKILLNGKSIELTDVQTVSQLLDSLDMKAGRVAVELNREIIRKESYESQAIQDGDEIEVLQFVGGGSR
ncbi:MAG: sulfur carrier protein ThiS [bacterium]|nr:sulfur carrier protein ThiS [bacterium]